MDDRELVKNCFKKLQNRIRQIEGIDPALGGICEKYWLVCNKKKYLFKLPGKNDYSDFGEVFTSYLSYLIGYKCVKSIFFKNPFKVGVDEQNGVLIETYYKKNTTEEISLSWLIDRYQRRHFSGYTVNEVMELCNEFAKDKKLVLDNKLEQELKEMALMDYLLLQQDRHANNIAFLINEVNGVKVLTLAPMFDNGFCLYLSKSIKQIDDLKNQLETQGSVDFYSGNCDNLPPLVKYTEKTNENKEKFDVKSVLGTDKWIKMGFGAYANIPPLFYIESTEEINNMKENITRDLATELLHNKSLMKLYKEFKEVDLKSELNFINTLTKRLLPQNYIETILLGVNNRISLLDFEVAKQTVKEELVEKVV